MNIGLLSQYWDRPNKTGIEVFATEIFSRLRPKGDEHFYYLGANVRTGQAEHFVPLPKANRLWQLAWHLPRSLRQNKVDVFFNPSQYTTWGGHPSSVACGFDVAWKYFPEYFPAASRVAFELLTRNMVRYATKILSISEATRSDLIKYYRCEPNKVVTVPLGVDRVWLNEVPQPDDLDVLATYGLESKRFVLFLGTLQRRKNVETLIEAFNLLADSDTWLVLAGGFGWFHDRILEAIERSPKKEKIVVTGFLPEHHKPALYRSCAVFAYPSLYEGFGIPVLEAMACGCVCLTSNVSSLPEVIGEAGILVDPLRADQMAHELALALTGRYDSLKIKAIERSREFTWDRVAEGAHKLIREAAAAL